MTVIIGAIHEGSAYIGADSLYSWGDNFARVCKVSKFIPVPDDKFLLAGAGQDKFTQIFIRALKLIHKKEAAKLNITDVSSVYTLIDLIQDIVMKGSHVGEPDHNELPEHDMGLMIASKQSNKLWIIESDYSVMGFEDHICAGSGFVQGEAVMHALALKGIKGREAVETALNTVCELHPGCGGPIEIKELKLEVTDDTIIT